MRGRAIWILLAVLALGAGVAAALTFGTLSKEFAPAGPNRSLMPDSVAAYVELRGVGTHWDGFVKSQAYTDFQTSSMRERLGRAPAVARAVSMVEEVARRTRYPLTAANVTKLFGREVSVGFVPAGQDAPRWILLSKLDVAALSKDFLAGDGDFTKLHEAIDEKTGKLEYQVKHADHRGQRISTASKDGVVWHFALLGDTLAASDDVALLHRTIDAHQEAAKGSLAKHAPFLQDVAKLPADAFAVEWYDLGRIRAAKASSAQGLRALGMAGTGEGADVALDRLLKGTGSVATFARATALPDGDPYRMRWSYSVDEKTPVQRPLSEVLPTGALYMELRDTKGLLEAWDRSAVRGKLAASALGEQIDQFLDDPAGFSSEITEKLVGLAHERAGKPAPTGTGRAGADEVGSFEMRLFLHLAREAWTSTAGSSLAMAIETPKDGDADGAVVTHLDFGAQVFALLVEGYAIGEGDLSATEYRGYTILSQPREGAHGVLVHVGDLVVLASNDDYARKIVDALTSDQPAAPSRRTAALADAPEGTRLLLWLDAQAWLASIARGMPEGFREQIGFYGDITATVQVPDDFSRIESRWKIGLAANGPRYGAERRATPASWSRIPESAFLHAGSFTDFTKALHWWRNASGKDWAPVEEALADFERAAGVDFEKDLVPALGPELAFAMTFAKAQETAPGVDAEPPIPGVLLLLETKQQAVVRKAVDGLMKLAQEEFQDQPQRRSRKQPSIFKREAYEGTEIVRLVVPGEDMPFHPAFAFQGDFLVIGLDVTHVEAVIDAAEGRAKPVAEAPYTKRFAAQLKAGDGWAHADWGRVVDQIAQYADQLGSLVPGGGEFVPPPYPEQDDPAAREEWMAKMQKAQLEQSKAGGARLRRWLDVARVVDSIGSVSRWTPEGQEMDVVLLFAP